MLGGEGEILCWAESASLSDTPPPLGEALCSQPGFFLAREEMYFSDVVFLQQKMFQSYNQHVPLGAFSGAV